VLEKIKADLGQIKFTNSQAIVFPAKIEADRANLAEEASSKKICCAPTT